MHVSWAGPEDLLQAQGMGWGAECGAEYSYCPGTCASYISDPVSTALSSLSDPPTIVSYP